MSGDEIHTNPPGAGGRMTDMAPRGVRASGSEDLFKDIPVEADEIEDLMKK